MIQQYNGHLFVGVPKEAQQFWVELGTLVRGMGESFRYQGQLPDGNWSIVGLAKNLTEEQKTDIVLRYVNTSRETFYNANDAYYSLLKHLGFKPDENVLILAQNN